MKKQLALKNLYKKLLVSKTADKKSIINNLKNLIYNSLSSKINTIRSNWTSAGLSKLNQEWVKKIENYFSVNQKEAINYISSRHMRKNIAVSNFVEKNLRKDFLKKKIEEISSIKKYFNMSEIIDQRKVSGNLVFFPNSTLFYRNSPTLLGLKVWFKQTFFSKEVASKEDALAEKLAEDWGGVEAYKLIIFLGDNFDEVVSKLNFALVFFSASWCPHCMKLRKQYGRAALMAKEANLPVRFATFDVSTNPDIADAKGVVGIPFIKYYQNGMFVSNYRGKRSAEDLFEFVKNPPTLTEQTQPDV